MLSVNLFGKNKERMKRGRNKKAKKLNKEGRKLGRKGDEEEGKTEINK